MRERKKLLLSLIIIASILGLVIGYLKHNKAEELKLGRYVMQEDSRPESWTWVLLKENSQFEFNRGIVSYRPRGTYSIKDGKLILYVSEKESYVFTIDGDKLIFDRGDFVGNLVKEGAIFKLSDKE
ncbi:hypothetical protein [Alkaliphilus serpentinus]|uniref:DUF5640 domain-containing protein n=1 Tax=Alkaliphilus serpentinus TaxID=1482731 RepID=A0A833HMA4_9FIRM|nr:hypothetical protein [Alkaliphilus serpentinus]KAB3527288.1 hypothetical protein F8153_12560 [Alkaliphilus serpentinus]